MLFRLPRHWADRLFITFTLLFLAAHLVAQDNYFQQEVNYRIKATLNDVNHILKGEVEMTYTNNAPAALEEIYIHLWANAHQGRETALAKQKLRMGDTRLYFAGQEDLGGYSELNFTVNGQQVATVNDDKHPDILKLVLNAPLEPGQQIIINTPFALKIPGSFSRLGRVGTSYQMTQWYPKPAVYDKDGWHPMPYLDIGEFYSEFGAFDVELTLPKNYVVAATGELQTESERVFLAQKIKESASKLGGEITPGEKGFPASDSITKTIRYTAERVHDFAWFADKRFYVTKDQVTLASGKTVDTWAFFTDTEAELWKKGTVYVNRAVKFYSNLVGEYPYPQATAVQSALSAGAGMEYPMITVIGLSGDSISLDDVITHEVGHNWFYGILASNERDHPWLDEGLNSYYDHRYHRQYYGDNGGMGLPAFITKGSDANLFSEAYRDAAIKCLDQAPDTHSDEFSMINYGLSAYEKPAMILRFLAHYVGQEKFDQAMQTYYREWQFKHPSPNDFRTSLEKSTGENLSWLFDDLFGSAKHVDYKMEKLSIELNNTKLAISNDGEMPVPFPVTAYRNGEAVATEWFAGFTGKKTIDFPGIDYDELIIDADKISLETDFKNNNIKTSGLFRKGDPLRLKFLLGLDNRSKENVFWTPYVGYNAYDGGMFGLALYNNIFPARRFEYFVAPAYGFNSKDLAGVGSMRYNFFSKKSSKLYKWSVGVDFRQFHYNETDANGDFPAYDVSYRKIRPSLRFDFGKGRKSTFYHQLELQAHLLWEEEGQFVRDSSGSRYLGNEWINSNIYSVVYAGQNKRAINPYAFEVRLEQQSYETGAGEASYLKASFEWNSSYTYNRKRSVDFRIFGGAFLQNDARNKFTFSNSLAQGSFSLIHQAKNDYRYDRFFFGRSEQTGFWTQQVSLEDGGFKNITTAKGDNIGQSNNFILAVNLKADLPQDLPLDLPIKPYFDLGYFDQVSTSGEENTFNDQFIFSGGLMLDLFDGAAGVYFPLFHSDNLDFQMKSLTDNYWQRITFSINLQRLNPRRLADGIGR